MAIKGLYVVSDMLGSESAVSHGTLMSLQGEIVDREYIIAIDTSRLDESANSPREVLTKVYHLIQKHLASREPHSHEV